MSKEEILKQRIERERQKLDNMIIEKKNLDEVYRQSVALDQLIEQYLNSQKKITA